MWWIFLTVFVVALPAANFTTRLATARHGKQVTSSHKHIKGSSLRLLYPAPPLSLSHSLALFYLLRSSILHKLFRIYFGLPVHLSAPPPVTCPTRLAACGLAVPLARTRSSLWLPAKYFVVYFSAVIQKTNFKHSFIQGAAGFHSLRCCFCCFSSIFR